jgi:hypothetical protein
MNKIKGNFFEEHVEKIVLIVFCMLCMAILIMGVLLSPNGVNYDGKKYGPADIDNYIAGNAKSLNDKLNEPATPKEAYVSKVGEFSRLIDSSANINVSYDLDMPKVSDVKPRDNTKYDLPTVGSLGTTDADHIRAVAYIPKNTITMENAYTAENSQVGDIDLVTVQSQIDISRLNSSFDEVFGTNPLAVLQDPCLVKPIFAAVELQRQELTSDGGWSDWVTIERTKVDKYKETLQVIENVNGLGNGGMKVRMLQFNNISLQMALLQPEIYKIASADEIWLPPSLHREYAKMQKDELLRTKRLERDAENQQKQQKDEEKRQLRLQRAAADKAAQAPAPDAKAAVGEEQPVVGRGQDRNLNNPNLNNQNLKNPNQNLRNANQNLKTANLNNQNLNNKTLNNPKNPKNKNVNNAEPIEPVVAEPVSIVENFVKKTEEFKITETTNLAQMDKPIVFWAHDDSVEPGKTYQYRIRIGVFNPLAGTDKLKEGSKSLKDQVILWSDFAEVKQTISIPLRTYFFANDMIEN